MNTKLYNALVQAWNFLATLEKNEKDLIRRQELINRTPIDYKIKYGPSFPHCNYKEFRWGIFLVLLLFFPLLSVLYAIYIYLYNWKYRKVNRTIDNWEKSPDGVKLSQEIQKNIEKQQKEYESKLSEYKKYYSDNYYIYLGFLPSWVRKFETVDDISSRKDYIDGLIQYVKCGATTLDNAMEYYAKALREERATEERKEREERLEQLQEKNIEALGTIARNQEKTNDELEKIYRDTFINRH